MICVSPLVPVKDGQQNIYIPVGGNPSCFPKKKNIYILCV